MPTEETTSPTTPETPATPPAGVPNTEPAPVENMVPQSRFNELNKQLKEAKQALDAFQKTQKDAEDATLAEQKRFSELYEKEQKKAASLETRLTDMQATARRNTIKAAIEAEARKANFSEPADAHLFIDLDSIETDDKGNPKEVEALVKGLAKTKPYLLQTTTPAPGNGKLPKPAGAAGSGDAAKAAQLAQADWGRRQF